MLCDKRGLFLEKLTLIHNASVWFPPILMLGACTVSRWDIRRNWTIILSFRWMIQSPLILALSGACVSLANTSCSLSLGCRRRAINRRWDIGGGQTDQGQTMVHLSEPVCPPPTLTFSAWQAPQNWPQQNYQLSYLFRCYPALVNLFLFSSSQIYSHLR
jgi:hypothetical protein